MGRELQGLKTRHLGRGAYLIAHDFTLHTLHSLVRQTFETPQMRCTRLLWRFGLRVEVRKGRRWWFESSVKWKGVKRKGECND